MNNDYKVSVIIPIYNAEKYIEKNLNHILNQTYKNIEIILVDDGSIDESTKICKKLERDNDKIKLFCKKNGGPSSARNFGLNNCSGELVFFCDSDDYIDPAAIENLVELYKKDSSRLFGLSIKNVVNNKIVETKHQGLNYSKNAFFNAIFDQTVLGGVCRFLFEKSKIGTLSFDINTKCMEDTIFLIEYINNNFIENISFIDSQYYYYVSNSSSLTNKKNSYEKCCNYAYSLNTINNITDSEYFNKINNNLIRIIESELDRKTIITYKTDLFEKIKIEIYSDKNLRYKFFSMIFFYKNILLLKIYYTIKNILKMIKRGVE